MTLLNGTRSVGENKISHNVKALAMLGIRKYKSLNKNK
jgi:hypothetical protein